MASYAYDLPDYRPEELVNARLEVHGPDSPLALEDKTLKAWIDFSVTRLGLNRGLLRREGENLFRR